MSKYLTADQLIASAPKDIEEDDVEAFGGVVKIRALTAAQQARIRQASIKTTARGANVDWAAMERMQFELGVVEPKLDTDQVKKLHMESGQSFQAVIGAIDKLSGTDKEALRQAQEDFQESGD